MSDGFFSTSRSAATREARATADAAETNDEMCIAGTSMLLRKERGGEGLDKSGVLLKSIARTVTLSHRPVGIFLLKNKLLVDALHQFRFKRQILTFSLETV